MIIEIDNYVPKHSHVLCVDSDGTAIDSMNVKHNRCHGPAFIEAWELGASAGTVQKRWNEINLYEKTRGINRFLGAERILRELDGKAVEVKDLDVLSAWIAGSKELSEPALENAIEQSGSDILKKALKFSRLTNQKVAELDLKDKPAYGGVKQTLEFAKTKTDIAVISSCNMSAIREEWGYNGLLDYPDVITSLETGSKRKCLEKIIGCGAVPEKVLMVGDAIPDFEAAKAAGVLFYPIIVREEKQSWFNLRNKYLGKFLCGNYAKYQNLLIENFYKSFK